MAITSSFNTDTNLHTASISILLNGITTIDSFSYANSNQTFTFNTRNTINVSPNDFITKLNLFISFNNFLYSLPFNLNRSLNGPIATIDTTINDDGISQLDYVIKVGNNSFVDYLCNYPSGNVTIAKRNQVITLTFPQWMYFLNEINQYLAIVRRIYNI